LDRLDPGVAKIIAGKANKQIKANIVIFLKENFMGDFCKALKSIAKKGLLIKGLYIQVVGQFEMRNFKSVDERVAKCYK